MTSLVNLDALGVSNLSEAAGKAMSQWLGTNASPSSLHILGEAAAEAVEVGRDQIRSALGGKNTRVIFTSGAGESDNLAVIGASQKGKRKGKHILVCQADPLSVIQAAKSLSKQGWSVESVPVDSKGIIDLDALAKMLKVNTTFVSCHLVNEETGVIQPVAEVVELVREKSPHAHIHSSARAAVNRLHFNLDWLGLDSLSIDSQCAGGPSGIGALLLKDNIRINSILHGGAEEGGMRPGSLSTALVAGMGAAYCGINELSCEVNTEVERIISEKLMNLQWTIMPKYCAPGIISIRLPVGADALVLECGLAGVLLSPSSGCTASTGGPSHVLIAMGISENDALQTIRISLTHGFDILEISHACDVISDTIGKITA